MKHAWWSNFFCFVQAIDIQDYSSSSMMLIQLQSTFLIATMPQGQDYIRNFFIVPNNMFWINDSAGKSWLIMNTSSVWNIQQCANQLLELLWPALSFFTHQNECNLLLRPLHVQHNYIITCVCSQFRCLFSWQTDCDFTILQNGCVRKKLTNCIDHLTNLFNSYNRCATYRVLMYALEWWTSYFPEKILVPHYYFRWLLMNCVELQLDWSTWIYLLIVYIW